MGTIKKAVGIITKAIGSILGTNFPTAADFLARNYPYYAYGC